MNAQSYALEAAWRFSGNDAEGREVLITVNQQELTNAYPGITVGRHPRLCERIVGEASVSRRHFRLARSAEGVTVEDLSSLNGTFLDGRRLTPYAPAVLGDGQTLTVGRVSLTVARLAAG